MSDSKVADEDDRTIRLLLQRQATWSRYGNRKVCCGGHIVVGPIRSWWWILEIWTVIVAAIFASEYNEYHIGVLAAGLVLFVICIGSCLAISFGDPGILPKPTFSEAYRNAREVSIMLRNGIHHPFRNVTVGDEIVRYTYCMRCHHFRPPQAGHCYTCDSCIEHWDHHCPIFGGCVGRKNFVAFHVMCISQALIWTFWLSVSGFATANVAKERPAVPVEEFFWRCKALMCVLIGLIGAGILPFFLSRSKCEKNMCEPKPRLSVTSNIASHSLSKESSLCKKTLRVFPHDKLQNFSSSAHKDMSGDWSTTALQGIDPPPRFHEPQTYFSGDFTLNEYSSNTYF